VFAGSAAVSTVVTLLGIYIGMLLLLTVAAAMYPRRTAAIASPRWDSGWTDTVVTAVGGLGLLLLVGAFGDTLDILAPGWITFEGWGVPGFMGAPLPWLVLVGETALRTAALAGVILVVSYLWKELFRGGWLRTLLIVLLLIAGQNASAVGWQEWTGSLLRTLVALAGLALLMWTFVRGSGTRLIAFAWTASLAMSAGSAWAAFPAQRVQVAAGVLLALAVLAGWLALPRRTRGPAA
jgi:hypothetical protein